MSVKYYRYPSDIKDIKEEEQDLESLGSYASYEEDEYLNLPVVPKDLEKALNSLYEDSDGTLPLVVQYIDDIKDLNRAYVGPGSYWDGEFSSTEGKYYIAGPEYGLDICVVPKNLKEDLNFVFNLYEFDEDDDNDWLPKTKRAFETKLKKYGLDTMDYKDILAEYYNTRPSAEGLIKNYKSGNLDLRDTNIIFLPEGLEVEGYLDLHNTPITSLPEGLKVGGSLYLSDTPITSLPEDLEVGEDLYLENTKITSLPKSLKVKGDLYLENTKITSLPKDFEVGGWLFLSNAPIISLPEGLKVGNLSLKNTNINITSLPKGLEVRGSLYLVGKPITFLPEGLRIGRTLDLGGTKITSLPEDLEVGGNIYLPDGTEVNSVEEAREYLAKQNKQKNSSRLSKAFRKIESSSKTKILNRLWSINSKELATVSSGVHFSKDISDLISRFPMNYKLVTLKKYMPNGFVNTTEEFIEVLNRALEDI